MYGVSAVEVCPTTGRTHVQFYICFSCVKRLSWLRENVGHGASFIACKGDPDQNIKYVMKTREEDEALGVQPNEDVEEFGIRPRGLAERTAGMDNDLRHAGMVLHTMLESNEFDKEAILSCYDKMLLFYEDIADIAMYDYVVDESDDVSDVMSCDSDEAILKRQCTGIHY